MVRCPMASVQSREGDKVMSHFGSFLEEWESLYGRCPYNDVALIVSSRDHVCEICGKKILKGESFYFAPTIRTEGEGGHFYTHKHCYGMRLAVTV